MRRLLARLAIAAKIIVFGPIFASTSVTSDAELDARLNALSRQLRCLVCQNETLADSRADLALDLRREIREQMKAGRTDEQITAFLTARYGDFVLYRPSLKPTTYVLWFGPFVLLIGGFAALYRHLIRRVPGAFDGPALSPADRTRARRLLDIRQGDEIT